MNPYESPLAMAKYLLDRSGVDVPERKLGKIALYLEQASQFSMASQDAKLARFWLETRAALQEEWSRRKAALRDA